MTDKLACVYAIYIGGRTHLAGESAARPDRCRGRDAAAPPRSADATGYTHGFEVIAITPESPAERAGVRVEDVLVDLDGIPVRDASDLQRLMTGRRIGAPLDMRLVRGGRVQTVVVVPEELATST